MDFIKSTWQWMFSPKLNKVYGGPIEQIYEPATAERWGDQVVTLLNIMWKFGVYTSPFLVGIMYRRGYLISENLVIFTKCFTTFGLIYIVSLCLRGFGRANNDIYQNFLHVLKHAQHNMNPENKKLMSKYDFDFAAWPVEFQYADIKNDMKKGRLTISRSSTHRSLLQCIMRLPCKIIGSVAIHTFGLRIIYPGSLSLVQTMLSTALLQGRSKLVEEYQGQRFKLKARDGNDIDSMFIDQRHEKTPRSKILVICCEGNAGFYEIGIMSTPVNAGYSVLGWNHPGFAYSSGKPYPENEQNAIEIVIEFAIHKLDFKIEDIILFGWSIGGYSSSWAAMNYPNIKGLVLDATFDDILPLAIQHMPSWWESIVVVAIRDHVNLNNFEQVKRYPGSLLLIRRTDDEVICTIENNIATNRGNYMLIKLMKHRYPNIFENEQIKVVIDYLGDNISNQGTVPTKYKIDSHLCLSIIQSYVFEHSNCFPMELGKELENDIKIQLALFLTQKYMKDYRSTHCTPLPVEMFSMPWNLTVDNEYVFT